MAFWASINYFFTALAGVFGACVYAAIIGNYYYEEHKLREDPHAPILHYLPSERFQYGVLFGLLSLGISLLFLLLGGPADVVLVGICGFFWGEGVVLLQYYFQHPIPKEEEPAPPPPPVFVPPPQETPISDIAAEILLRELRKKPEDH